MAMIVENQFVRPDPVMKKLVQEHQRSVISSKKRPRENTTLVVIREKYQDEMKEYLKLESRFLSTTSEVSALNSMQQMRDLLIQVPSLSVLVTKQRILQAGKSKRSINPERWSAVMAKSFGKLIMVLGMSMKRFESRKRIKTMTTTSVSSPRNSVAALQLLALAKAGVKELEKEKTCLKIKIKVPKKE